MSLDRIAQARAITEDIVALGDVEDREDALPTPQQAQAGLTHQLIGYIPGDALALFVALSALVTNAPWWARLLALLVVVVASPAWVLIRYREAAQTHDALAKWPAFEMIVGLIAFLAWSASVPGAFWQEDVGLPAAGGAAIAITAAAFIGIAVTFRAQSHRIPKPST